MSQFNFSPSLLKFMPAQRQGGSLRRALSHWILKNHGEGYRAEVTRQRARPQADFFRSQVREANLAAPTPAPLVGIIGGGFAGLYAGLILQSLGIDFELFESSDRVGGRIRTWYSSEYSADDVANSGLYGEIGGMRLPQFSEDMLPVQQVALAVNAVLGRNGLADKQVWWRKFYYNSEVQRLRYNNMASFVQAVDASLNTLNFDVAHQGDIPQPWFTVKKDVKGNKYLPINQVFGQVISKFVKQLSSSFAAGFNALMRYDKYSMWSYLTTVFTLGDLEDYYDPALGGKNDALPWSVASYLETTQVGTNMNSVSFVEMVIAIYDWGGSVDPYLPADSPIGLDPFRQVFMLTVDKGMQHFPDACETVLNLADAVRPDDGIRAQEQVGMLAVELDGKKQFAYSPPNLRPDAVPPHAGATPPPAQTAGCEAAGAKQRVFRNHKVVEMVHDPLLYDQHGGMKLKIKATGPDGDGEPEPQERQYPYVISTLPFGMYLSGDLKDNLLNDLSFAKAQALRECNYMNSFKAFLTFDEQFWATLGERQEGGLGAAATDRPNRQIIYPSYGYPLNGEGPRKGVLQVYCWAEDAQRLGALTDEARINECLKGIQYLYPDANIYDYFAGYDDGRTTKTWFWDQQSGGGAFALFAPEQFKNLYPVLLTPEFDGCLNIAGEACSVHHGWIVGALDSAYNAVNNILLQIGDQAKIKQMRTTWGSYATPDVAPDSHTTNVLDYATQYNLIDRQAGAVAPNASASIYPAEQANYVFEGTVPPFIRDYAAVPQAMMMTSLDHEVQDSLNDLWNDNVALRTDLQALAAAPGPLVQPGETAVQALERIYYGDNFQTIPRPKFWLKDDDEFARQQTGGFMPDYLTRVSPDDLQALLDQAGIPNEEELGPLAAITYVADFRQYVAACTVIPTGYYLAKPLLFFRVAPNQELLPVGIQLEVGGPVFTPTMPNAENAWLLAKMQTNCAAQTLHDVVAHQLLTHQLCAMVSISLFSEDVFDSPDHPVFRLLRPHVVKTVEFMQSIYNRDYVPNAPGFPETRDATGQPGVYQLGFVYDLIFSCGRIGNYQLQNRVFNAPDFNFLDLAIGKNSQRRGVQATPFSYPYVHDSTLWYQAMSTFVGELIAQVYPGGDADVAGDAALQRFFTKLIPAFNHVEGSPEPAQRFPAEVKTTALLHEVLTMFVWQFSVQHTVVNDGAYDMAAFVPNASTLMYPLPTGTPASWTATDVLKCLPDNAVTYQQLGGLNFMDIQLNASVTGQGPYPETVFGRGVLEPSIDFMQDLYGFVDHKLRGVVNNFYRAARQVGEAIEQRQWQDIAKYKAAHPESKNVPETVVFDLITPLNVMTSILT
jgi:monoamine oxidase